MTTKIYHNPRCSKSRQTLALLEAHGISPEIIYYLDTPPTPATLTVLLKKLGLSAHDIMRKGEDEYKTAKAKIEQMNNTQHIEWLIAHPKVIERPIVVTSQGARLGRPPENVLEILPENSGTA